MDSVADRIIGQLKAKTIIALGIEFGLNHAAIAMAVDELHSRLETTAAVIYNAHEIHVHLRNQIGQLMERRWRGTFSLIGKQLSKKQ